MKRNRAVKRLLAAVAFSACVGLGADAGAQEVLKIGTLVRVSVRRIKIAMASSCPAAQIWGRAAVRLNAAASARGSPA